MKKILIISGHPNINDSFANKIILEEVNSKLPNSEIRYLDKLYPDFKIDSETEQASLIKADVIVFQFPIFWYSMPSLLHRWVEDTFVHGFSHGSTGDKLKGKKLILSFTTGAPESMYQYGGLQSYPIEDFLLPIKQMAKLCQLDLTDFIYTGGLSYASRNDETRLKEMKNRSIQHADKLVNKLKSL